MWSTGDPCLATGTYRSRCCKAVLALGPGFYFPTCFRCGQEVPWEKVNNDWEEKQRGAGV